MCNCETLSVHQSQVVTGFHFSFLFPQSSKSAVSAHTSKYLKFRHHCVCVQPTESVFIEPQHLKLSELEGRISGRSELVMWAVFYLCSVLRWREHIQAVCHETKHKVWMILQDGLTQGGCPLVCPAGGGDRRGHGVLRAEDEGHPGTELQQRRRLQLLRLLVQV